MLKSSHTAILKYNERISPVTTLRENIASYMEQRESLEQDHWGRIAIFHDRGLVTLVDDWHSARIFRDENFYRDDHVLIRKIGAPVSLESNTYGLLEPHPYAYTDTGLRPSFPTSDFCGAISLQHS